MSINGSLYGVTLGIERSTARLPLDGPLLGPLFAEAGGTAELAYRIQCMKDELVRRAVHAGLDTDEVWHVFEGDAVYVACNSLIPTSSGSRRNLSAWYSFSSEGEKLSIAGNIYPILAPWLIGRIKVVPATAGIADLPSDE